MKYVFVTLSIMTFGFLGCGGSTGPELEINNYPLAAGYVWNYTGQYSTFNFRPLQQGATFRDTVIQWAAKAEIVGQVVLRDTVTTWKFRSTQTLSSTAFDEQYYIQKGDTLFQYAYRNGNLGFPKNASTQRFLHNGLRYKSLDELINSFIGCYAAGNPPTADSIVYDPVPPKVLLFPLKSGLEWSYRKKGTPFGRIDKKVIGLEQVSVPAILYATYKIEWLWDLNQDDQWDTTLTGFDYIGTKGIIKRTFIFKDVGATSIDPNQIIGLFDIKFEYVLRSTNVR